MKVLHHTNNFYKASQTFVIDVIRGLIDQGLDSMVFTHDILNTDSGLHVVDLSESARSKLMRRIKKEIYLARGYCHDTNFPLAKKELLAFMPDLIHCHFGTAAYYSHFVQKYAKTNIPTVISLHGYDVFKRHVLANNYAHTLQQVSKKNNVCFTVPSEYLKKVTIEALEIPAEKIHVVYNGFNANIFQPNIISYSTDKCLRISNIGRFVDWKSQHILVEAAALLVAQGFAEFKIDFVGDGELLKECRNLADELGVAENCIFHGAVKHDRVAEIISTSHLYVHTASIGQYGQTETFGVSMLEAVAMGKPVIYFKVGGIPEIFEQVTTPYFSGVNEISSDRLASEIIDISELLNGLDEKQFNIDIASVVSSFSSEKCIKRIVDLYKIVAK
jgi:glycosyltransferase involved in cell wall biosynthesis